MTGGLQEMAAPGAGRPPDVEKGLAVLVELMNEPIHQGRIGPRMEVSEGGVVAQAHAQRQLRGCSPHGNSSSWRRWWPASYSALRL